MHVVVDRATMLLNICFGKEGLHIWIYQVEIDLDRGFLR